MKIIKLTAENVKRLKVVDITPKDNLIEVTGKNGSGKTSVLDSIWWALGGKKNIQSVPIHKGAEEARIRLDLGTLIVKRTFTPTGTTVIVLNPVGAEPGTPDSKLPKWGSPQEMLDALMGELSFDPLAFARMDARKQFDQLRQISKLTVDIDALDAATAADFKKRTDINRDAKAMRARADGIVVHPNTPVDPLDESALLNEIQGAAEHNAQIEVRKAKREQARRDVDDLEAKAERKADRAVEIRKQGAAKISELKRQIETLERETEAEAVLVEAEGIAARERAEVLRVRLDTAEPLPEPIAVTEIRLRLEAAKAVNESVAKRKQREDIIAEAAALEAESRKLTDQMTAREKEKIDAIRAAKMPIPDIGFGDGFVTYKDLPFDQASDAERLRVSTAIAMAENPKLRVIRIRDGSLLDDDAKRMLAELAREKDYQIWMEVVDSSGQVGIVMEDGQVVADHYANAEATA